MIDLPRRFEVVHRGGKNYYIVDFEECVLYPSPKGSRYSRIKDMQWRGYTKNQIRKYIDEGVWIITEYLSDDEVSVEVGDLL